jgi:hypothetical protein
MKNTINHLMYGALILCSLSCEVDRLPETQITDASFWKTEKDIREGCNYLYSFLTDYPNQLPLEEVWSDNAYGGTPDNTSDGTRLAPATSDYYSGPYQLVRAANNILEKAPGANVTTAVRDRYLAEALFFRAYAYYQLIQKYGSVPLILKILPENSPELTQPVTPRQVIMNQIYADLDVAATNLPTYSQLGAANYGRVAKSTALALKARIALFEGTRAKFHKDGDATKHLQLAAEASKAIIDSKQHSLLSRYFTLFQYEGEGFANKEVILVKQYGASTNNIVLTHLFPERTVNGWLSLTKALVDSYLMKDGLPISKSPLYKTPVASTDEFTDRDLRLNETIFKRGDPYTVNTTYTVPLAAHKTGFGPKKYFNAADVVTRQGMIDWIFIRYAEVLLTYAEAKYEIDGTISDADLDLTINALRVRAQVAKLSNAFVTANGLDMREEIRRERRVELALENLRYWDLIRWKTAEIELPKPLLGSYYFEKEYGKDTPVQVDKDNYIVVQAASFRRFDPAKDYLWPFPVNEIGLNPALKQNPGW